MINGYIIQMEASHNEVINAKSNSNPELAVEKTMENIVPNIDPEELKSPEPVNKDNEKL